MLTKQQLQEMKEDPLTRDILIPLFSGMGYKDVQKHHGGSGELGKDIVCWTTDELDYRVNIAIIVKAVPITGTLGIAMEVAGQIMQSFGAKFLDKGTGEEQYVAKCYVVTNKEISKEARSAIQAFISNLTRSVLANVRYIDGDELWEWYQKYLAEKPLWQKLSEVSQELDTVDSHYRLEAHLTNKGTEITAVEKYPGAALENPITIKSTFAFPTDTEEGRALAEGIEAFFASGTPIKVPLTYIKNLDLPEFVKRSLPEFTDEGFFFLGPAHNPKPLLLRFEFTNEDSEQFILEYVHLKVTQAGQQEITLTNDEQPIPIKVKVVLRANGSMSTQFEPIDTLHVHEIFMQLKCQQCLSKPYTARLINLETGIVIADAQRTTQLPDAPPVWLLQVIEALNAFQIKVGRQIIIPDRELTQDELQMLERLRRIYLYGKEEGTLNSLSSTISTSSVPIQELREVLKPFAEGQCSDLSFFLEEAISLFDVVLPLGKIKPIHVKAKLVNEKEVQEQIGKQEGCEIELKFVPAEDSTILKEYIDWLN